MGRNSTFAYTSPREKLGLIQNILRQLYEAPTRGNNGKGDLYLASMSQGQIADALHVDRSTVSRIFGDPRMRPHMERYGIARYKDPTAKGTEKRYIFDPDIATILTSSEDTLASVVDQAKAMLYSTTTVAFEDTNSKSKSSSKPAGIELTAGQKLWLEKYDKIHKYYREMLPDVATEAFEWLMAKWLEEKIVNVTLNDKTTAEKSAELLEQYKTETGKEYAK